ncbi:splicing factor 3a subunit 3 noi [Brevipalpus obovatus]|uniref:splicing factor 3a subunit 3 noi n=1 Tax=Brevipalpus obovatus TaxID=246614 RepID=UPI003D9DFF9F
MESILEQQRSYHEERERIEETMVREMMAKKGTHKDQMNSEHRLKYLIDRYADVTRALVESYEDKDGSRKDEIASMQGVNEFGEFYSRLRLIKEFHKKNPNETIKPMSMEYDEFLKMRELDLNLIDFTAEEGYGKFLDLHECFYKYCNLKRVEKMDYLSYLSKFDHLFEIPKERKTKPDYKEYLTTLIEYLSDYCARAKPLLDLDEEMENTKEEFLHQWESDSFPGWPKEVSSALAHSGVELDLTDFNSLEDFREQNVSAERLKTALQYLGLKCGGTWEERANRLLHTKGKDPTEWSGDLFVKEKPGKAKKNVDTEKLAEIALMEAQVYRLSEILSEQRFATRENVQRKQARTVGEREASDEEESESESDEELDSEIMYNPKNVPLGWDGKPIPYWLYKLHGLNITYTCEICGNATYKGPKAFQLHFAEWRHAHGMRCLGVPNTAHFANVTKIEDALRLWNKLKDEKQREKFLPATEEEYEDSEGRVVNKKTYEDLKRQGLL